VSAEEVLVGDVGAMSDDELVAEHRALDDRVQACRRRMGDLHDEMERRAAAAADVARFGEDSATAEEAAAAQAVDVSTIESTEDASQ
jgi:ElaB/YqjD/DUF883 family membrane-anchored ribosome-binding protein